jgi:nitrobindin-like protein
VDQLAILIGTWSGTGHEEYPTVDDAEYAEEMTFSHAGEGFLTYVQRAWAPASGATLHAEAGFWRPGEPGRIEVCLGHPLGLAEISEGTVEGATIELRSRTVARSATGEPVSGVERRYAVDGDTMSYDLWMALDHVEMTHHLSATLRRA